MINYKDEATIREVLTAQASTRRALKIERARQFLEALDQGTSVAKAWQIVELRAAELAESADAADIEAKVLWVMVQGGTDEANPGGVPT